MKINKIICGDCKKQIPKHLEPESIDLIYMDPPFFSNKNYEIIWGNGAELKAYGDRWEGGIKHYIGWMEERIRYCFNVLKKTGSFYLHCDKYASHYLKVMCDRIFGKNNFINEIVWDYSGVGKPIKKLKEKHDIILYYAKTDEYTFNVLSQMPTNPLTIKRYDKTDGDGRKYKEYTTKGTRRIVYMKPVPLDDVWHLSVIGATSRERIGYPTQKPETLLERIIKISSNKGDIVLDPFSGGGTTIAVAKKLGRRWIGIDVSPIGCVVSYKRMKGIVQNIGKNKNRFKDIIESMTIQELLEIVDYPLKVSDVMKLDGYQFQQWAIIQLGADISPTFTNDGGIDGRFVGGTPIEIKQGDVGRPAVQKLHSVVMKEKRKKGVIVGKSFSSQAKEYIAEIKRIKDGYCVIIPLTIKDLIERNFDAITDKKVKMFVPKPLDIL